jgi:asparagine synthase (glutamine-hydrolysing)
MQCGIGASEESGMSVQAGIWNLNGEPVDRRLLGNLSHSLMRQGPDGESCEVSDSIALLYRPFHTTAESRREKQPYTSPRGFILTWDGRLDNREELLCRFGHDLESDPTDVAIVAAAFDHWETHCFPELIGDWAVSIWMPQQRELIFAIDYMAIRHIFYDLNKDRIWWSTDLAALILLSGNKFQIDDDYIAGYFANDPDAHLTPYRGIREVPPGQSVRIHNRKIRIERYWQFSPKSRIRYKRDAQYEEHFRHLFRQSVQRRLRSDCPVLAELSGGLDSTSIVCMADDLLAKRGAPRLDTLSNFDKTEPHGDDFIYFQKVEAYRGRIGHHLDVSKCVSSDSLEYPDFSAFPGCLGVGRTLQVERANIVRAGGYRAVLSGTGGDEFMGGVPDPREHLADLLVQAKFITLAKQLVAWSLVKRKPWIQLLWQSAILLLPPYLGRYLTKEGQVEQWLKKEFTKRTQIAIRQLGPSEYFGLRLPTRRAYMACVLAMANKMSLHAPRLLALEEPRYPYLDKNLVEFIMSIPASQLLRPGERRSLMRRSLIGIVPPEILSRRSKQLATRTPIVALQNNLAQLETALHSSVASGMGYIDQARFFDAFRAAKNGKPVHTVRLLKTVALEFWLRDLIARGLLDFPSTSALRPTRQLSTSNA